MGCILNLNWRMVVGNADSVGWRSPVTTPSAPLWPYQQMAAQIPAIAAAGFSAIVLPPSTEGAAGVFSGGYDKKDDYSLENTAFGTAEMLRQLVAVAHARGLQVYGDLVLHQYDGGNNGTYATKRFPKTPSCFTGIPGGVAADPVPDETGNFAFGNLAAYVEGRLNPGDAPGYMHDGAIAASQWLTRTIGFDGYRIDDAKGTNAQVVYDILHAEYMSNLFAFFEYFDGNPSAIGNYVNGYEKRRGSVLDFAFKFNTGNICNNNSRVWMGQCANIGWCDIDASTALTFCESADTDTSPGEQTIWNKIEQYAIMLTKPGYPSVYYRDWSADPDCYGMKAGIDNLVWIHEKLAQGEPIVRLDSDPQVFVLERTGYGNAPGCVFFMNNDQYNSYVRTVQTQFGAYRRMHEYSGNGSVNDIWTDEYGNLTVAVPRNDNGRGYVVYAPAGVEGGFSLPPIRTQQVLWGAADLVNTSPLRNATLIVGSVWSAAHHPITIALDPDRTDWGNSVEIQVEIAGPTGPLGMLPYDDQGNATQSITVNPVANGWHTFTATCSGLPAAGSPFSLTTTYMGGTLP